MQCLRIALDMLHQAFRSACQVPGNRDRIEDRHDERDFPTEPFANLPEAIEVLPQHTLIGRQFAQVFPVFGRLYSVRLEDVVLVRLSRELVSIAPVLDVIDGPGIHFHEIPVKLFLKIEHSRCQPVTRDFVGIEVSPNADWRPINRFASESS